MRIAVLNARDTVLGFLSNDLPDALHFYDDVLHLYLSGSAYTFSFKCLSNDDSKILEVGNRLAFKRENTDYYLNIVSVMRDEDETEVEAYGLSFELLNEEVDAYSASKAMTLVEYIQAMGTEIFSKSKIVANEVSNKSLTLEWTGRETLLKRLFSLASNFGAEIGFEAKLNNDYSLNVLQISIKEKLGKDRTGEVLRYGEEIEGIKKTSDITDVYTAIRPVGKDGLTLQGYSTAKESDGCYLSGTDIRNPDARDRFPSWAGGSDDYILKYWDCDVSDQATLYSSGLAELRKNCVPQVSYDVQGYVDAAIGDRFTIEDSEYTPTLYVEARVIEQEICFTDSSANKTTFDNFTEVSSELSSSILSQMNALIEKYKQYSAGIITDNGCVFKNGEGNSSLTAYVRDGVNDVTSSFTINWYKNGVFMAAGKTVSVNASDFTSTCVYKFQAIGADGRVRAEYELTAANVDDGAAGVSAFLHLRYSDDGGENFTANDGKTPGAYMGTYCDSYQQDSPDPADYTWVKIKGDKGEDGAKGQSLESLTTQYYLSTSNEEVTGGEWTDKYPDTFDSTKYLWTRHKAVFVDPSSTAYDDPVLDATWMTTISAVNSASEAAQSAQAATTAAENAQKSADDALKKADALGDELEPIKEGIDQAKQDAADAKAAVGNETETILNQVAETYATKGDMTSIQGDLEAKISSSATTLESTISEKITQNNSDIVDDTISAITAQLSESQTELDKLVSQQSEAQQKLNEANDRLTEAEDTLAKLQADPSATQAQIDAAETAVSDAQTEVDNAQADVEAAMQAIKDVNSAIGQILSDSASLASRVTTAETNIKQNSDAIALTATKTEVSDALENYYTKTESDANFTISSDKISASVTEQLKNVKLGGANLIPKSAFESGVVESLDSTKSFEVSQSGVLLSAPWAYATLAKGQTYTLHFEALATKQTDIASETAQADEEAADETSVQDDTPTEGTIKLYLHESVNDTNFETWATGTISSDGTIVTFTENVTVPDTVNDADLKWNLNMDVPFAVSVQNLKLESGTLATDWTPAPEDTDADIKNALQTAIEQANTNIQVEAGSIKTTLSEQYQTKYVDVTYTDDDGKQQTEQRELLSYISSQISASADNVTFQFQTKTDDIDRDIAGLATTAKNVNTYFNFTENGLEIGKTGDTGKDIYLHIDNNDMSFMSRSGGTLATFTESALEVNEVNVGSTLTFGTDTKKFRFVPHTDGSLGFRKA